LKIRRSQENKKAYSKKPHRLKHKPYRNIALAPNPSFVFRHALRIYVCQRAPVSRKNRALIEDLHKVAMESTIGLSAGAWAGGANGIIG
jgi:hypothetical protein